MIYLLFVQVLILWQNLIDITLKVENWNMESDLTELQADTMIASQTSIYKRLNIYLLQKHIFITKWKDLAIMAKQISDR